MSGIYIPNVEEPKTCCYCKMMVADPDVKWIDGDKVRAGGMICLWTGELIHNRQREEHCPLIPVSDHGRLIDADALERELREDADDLWAQYPYTLTRTTWFEAYEHFADIIAVEPTIIEAEVEKNR